MRRVRRVATARGRSMIAEEPFIDEQDFATTQIRDLGLNEAREWYPWARCVAVVCLHLRTPLMWLLLMLMYNK
jgi:hypothetical protein